MKLYLHENKINMNKNKNIKIMMLSLYLFFCSDALLFCFNSNQVFVTIAQYSMVALALALLFILSVSNKGNVPFDFLTVILVEVFVVLSAIYHSEFSGGYISKLSLLLMGYCVFKLFSAKIIFNCYLQILKWVCFVSLIGFFFSPVITRIPLPVIKNTLGREFRWFFLTNVPITNSAGRNYGPFTEPSRFQAYINFGIILLCFLKNEKFNLKLFVLYIITLITTFSTTGFISFGIIMVAFVFSSKVKLPLAKKVAIALCVACTAVLLMVLNEEFFNSIFKLKAGEESVSFAVRYNSLFGGIIMVFDNFVFGTGIANANREFLQATSSLFDVGQSSTYTNTVIMCFSKFGIVPGVYWIYNLYKTLKKLCIDTGIAMVVFVAIFCMLSGISFLESLFFNVIIFAHYNLDKETL